MHVSALYIYPVKGTAAVPVAEAATCPTGFVDDRRWMFVDRDGRFLSQREHRRLALVRATVAGNTLELNAPGMPRLRIPDARTGEPTTVEVWADRTGALRLSEYAGDWISDFLGTHASVAYMPDAARRTIHPDYDDRNRIVSFADAFPFLLISQESLDELNRRLERPMEMVRFRPNIVVTGARAPHAEDGWKRIRCGEVDFDVVKPCARCAVPTIDPNTAEPGKQPNRTLATYRRFGGQVYFGQNLIHRNGGTVRIGDAVDVLEAAPAMLPAAG